MTEFFWKDSFNSLGSSIDHLSDVVNHKDVDRIEYMRDATNKTSHVCGEEEAKRIFSNIKNYLPVL